MGFNIMDFTPMGVARKIGSALGIPDPKGYFDLYTGQAQIDAQKNAIAANLQMNADTNAANLIATRETNKQNYEIWKQARAEQRAYFDETNAYNSAAAQVERLKQAGLNPALAMYEGVNAGSTQAQTVPNAPSMIPPQFQAYYQNPVDTSAFQNNLPVLTQLATMGNNIAKSAADLEVSQMSAKLIASQFEEQVYRAYIAFKESTAWEDPEMVKAMINEKVSKAAIAMITAANLQDKEKVTIDSIRAQGKKAMSESTFIDNQSDIFKTNKGALNSIEQRIGKASDSILWDIAKLIFGYFGSNTSVHFSR